MIVSKEDYNTLLEYAEGQVTESEFIEMRERQRAEGMQRLRAKLLRIPNKGEEEAEKAMIEEDAKVKEFYDAEMKKLQERAKQIKEVIEKRIFCDIFYAPKFFTA